MTNPEQAAAAAGGPIGPEGMAQIGTVVDDPATGTSMPGSFRVELDKLPKLLTDLEAVKGKYEEIRWVAGDLRDIPAPGRDDVSTQAATALGQRAGNGHGELGWCATQARQRVQEMIEQVKGIINTYRNADEASEMGR